MENNKVSANEVTVIIRNTELIPAPSPSSNVVQEAIDKLVNQLNELNKPKEEN
jgi:hypothetical protein